MVELTNHVFEVFFRLVGRNGLSAYNPKSFTISKASSRVRVG